MTDRKEDFDYEAAVLANTQLGDALDGESGARILGTEKGFGILDTYETAMGSRTDTLTGLLNRAGWEDEMSKFFEIALREGRKFGIVMMDLDDFKKVNDEEGHVVGDKILRKFGQAILDRFRKGDICGRYGGDEAIVMMTTSNLSSNEIDEEENKMRLELCGAIGVGVSIGIANWDGQSTLETTIKKADGKLYHNKESRKNNV